MRLGGIVLTVFGLALVVEALVAGGSHLLSSPSAIVVAVGALCVLFGLFDAFGVVKFRKL